MAYATAMEVVDDDPKGWDSLPTELKLNIVKFLSLSAVSSLAKTNKASFDLLIDLLYQRDSVEYNSSAIFRATRLCSLTEDPETMGRVLARSVLNGGKVKARHILGEAWATALHIAAASGSAPITAMLLAAGADVKAPGRLKNWGGPKLDIWPILSQFNRDMICVMFSQAMWYPLLVPFLMGHHEIIHLLVQAGATGELAVEYEDGGDNIDHIGVNNADDDDGDDDDDGEMSRGITVHHVLAASEETIERKDKDGSCLFARFHDCIDMKLPAIGYTALHMSFDSPSTFAFDSLLQAGADTEATNDAGRTALLQACVQFCRAQGNREFVNRLRYFIGALLANGANVNYHQAPAEPASPLMALVLYMPSACDVPLAMWKEVIESVIDHGLTGQAINARPHHSSAIEMLWRSMNVPGVTPSLLRAKEAVLAKLVAAGGSLNQPAVGPDILQMQLIRFQQKPKSLLHLVLRLGARLNAQSVDEVFGHWLCNRRIRSIEGFDMMSYKAQISQRQIDGAFMKFFTGHPGEMFDMLAAEFPDRMPAERMVRKMLKRPMKRLRSLTILPAFNPHSRASGGRSFLHVLVGNLFRCPTSSVSIAVSNAEFLISRGVSTHLVDEMGRNVLHFLVNVPPRLLPLKILLTKAFEKERQDMKAQAAQREK